MMANESSYITTTDKLFYLGRNGRGYCRGFSVTESSRDAYSKNNDLIDHILFEPINSKGKVARCYFEFPVRKIPELIGILKDIHARSQHQ